MIAIIGAVYRDAMDSSRHIRPVAPCENGRDVKVRVYFDRQFAGFSVVPDSLFEERHARFGFVPVPTL